MNKERLNIDQAQEEAGKLKEVLGERSIDKPDFWDYQAADAEIDYRARENKPEASLERKEIEKIVDAVLFDWDGVLLNSMSKVAKVTEEVCRILGKEGITQEFVIENYIQPWWRFYEKIGIPASTEAEQQKIKDVFFKVFDSQDAEDELYPDVGDTLKQLIEKGIQIGIISAGNMDSIKNILKSKGLMQYFDEKNLVGSSHEKTTAIIRFCEDNNISPDKVLMVGDLPSDLEDGRRAGVKIAGMARSEQAVNKLSAYNPDFIMSGLGDELLKPRPLGITTPNTGSNEVLDEKSGTGNKVFDFLDKTGFLEMRKSDEDFAKWLESISYEDYINYLTRMNGLMRDKAIHDRVIDGNLAGKGVIIGGGILTGTAYIPPNAKDKDNMMDKTLDALKKIPNNNEKALLAYYSIQAIHPYMDGNGRTGRLLYELISDNGKQITREDLGKLLDHEKDPEKEKAKARVAFQEKVMDPGHAYYYMNRELIKELFGEKFIAEYGSIYYSGVMGFGSVPNSLNISPRDKELAEMIIGEADAGGLEFRSIVILKLLQENGKLKDCQYEGTRNTSEGDVIPEDVGKKIFSIDDEKFEASLNEQDIKRLIEIHGEIKQKFIDVMIDIFTNPDKHKVVGEKGETLYIKDYFDFFAAR